jgi:hypothetical protein
LLMRILTPLAKNFPDRLNQLITFLSIKNNRTGKLRLVIRNLLKTFILLWLPSP